MASLQTPLTASTVATPTVAAHAHLLADHLEHALRITRIIDALFEKASPDEPAFYWLLGRSEEVRMLTGEIVDDWYDGRIDGERAGAELGQYIESLHASLREWCGEEYTPSCCAPSGTTGEVAALSADDSPRMVTRRGASRHPRVLSDTLTMSAPSRTDIAIAMAQRARVPGAFVHSVG